MGDLRARHAALVILRHLVGEKDHAVALGEPLRKTGQELAHRQRHRHIAEHMECHHPVKKQVRLPLVDDLDAAVLQDEDGELTKVGADEIPNALLRLFLECEAFLQPTIWLIKRK